MRKPVAHHQRSPVPASEAAADVGRYAAEHRLNGKSAFDGDVEERSARQRADADDIAVYDPNAPHRCDRPRRVCIRARGNFYGSIGPRKRHPYAVGVDGQCGTHVDHLERSSVRRIAHERVGGAQAHRIERTARGNAELSITGPAEILDRSCKAGGKNA